MEMLLWQAGAQTQDVSRAKKKKLSSLCGLSQTANDKEPRIGQQKSVFSRRATGGRRLFIKALTFYFA